MRYNLNEDIFVISFYKTTETENKNLFFLPSVNDIYNDNISFSLRKIYPTQHIKVAWDYDPNNEKEYDGYILKDKEGNDFSNQFPFASYSQTSNDCDYLFIQSDNDCFFWDLEFYLNRLDDIIYYISHKHKNALSQEEYNAVVKFQKLIVDKFNSEIQFNDKILIKSLFKMDNYENLVWQIKNKF